MPNKAAANIKTDGQKGKKHCILQYRHWKKKIQGNRTYIQVQTIGNGLDARDATWKTSTMRLYIKDKNTALSAGKPLTGAKDNSEAERKGGDMTALEKQDKTRAVLRHNCIYGDGCPECDFFNPEDETDGEFFCSIRDSKKLIPFDDEWDMSSAMISD